MKRTFMFLLSSMVVIVTAFLACARPTEESSADPTVKASAVPAGAVQVWLTTGDENKKLQRQPDIYFVPGSGSSSQQIEVDETITYQQMDGFGAALTDSAAWLILNTLDVTQTNTLMSKLFSPTEGIGISSVRLPMGASDFVAESHYTYDDMPPGMTDADLASFSIAHDQVYILPLLRQAKSLNPQLKVMASPWSAPAWMKSPQTLYGGSLQPRYYQVYADYFVRFIQAYQAEGVRIDAVTVQNEPQHTDSGYPTMDMNSDEQAFFIKDHLGPTFAANGIDTQILAWDHNWDQPSYPLDVLNDIDASPYIVGSAWHCYAGSPAAQDLVHKAYPAKGIYFTECSGGEWDTDFASVLVWNYQNLFIGAVRHWAKTVMLWNLALSEDHGPHNGGCGNCRGVVTIYQDGTIEYNVEYYLIAHLSKFALPGAYRIASDTYEGGIETVAFRNADGFIVLVALNPNARPVTFDVQQNEQHFSYELPARSVVTFMWIL